MFNYIQAEFYKAFRRKYTWIALLVMVVLAGLLAWGFIFINSNGSRVGFSEGMLTMVQMLQVGFYATLITGDIVFAEQYKNSTLKNEVSFGIPRGCIYFGKFIVQFMLSVLYCVVLVAFYTAMCWLFLYRDPVEDMIYTMQVLGYCLGVALPLWAGMQALTCASLFLIRSSMGATITALGVLCVPDPALQIMSLFNFSGRELCIEIYTWLPTAIMAQSGKIAGDPDLFKKAWIVGAVWFVVFTAAGYVGFRRSEIK